MLTEKRKEQLLNSIEAYFEGQIEHMLRDPKFRKEMCKKVDINISEEDEAFIDGFYVHHIVFDVS